MINRRKRPLNPLRQKAQQRAVPQFKPKQTLPPLDLLADFQFTQKKQIKLSDINLKVLLKDMYPYYKLNSITTCLVLFHIVLFFWQQFHQNSTKFYKYFDQQALTISQFWVRLSLLIVYTNFLLIIGSYLQSLYNLWFIMSYGLSYVIGMLVFLLKQGSFESYTSSAHIHTATYSIYILILVEKKIKSKSIAQTWSTIVNSQIWKKISQLFNPKSNNNQQNQLIDFNFTQRPLSIKGGENDDSFSYDSFFSYSEPIDFLQQERSRQGYFESNISKRSSFISSFPVQQQRLKYGNINKFSTDNTTVTNKSFLSSSEIESTIASSQVSKNQKLQEEMQMIKIYKTIIFSYLVYMNVTKVEWIAYLVAVCGILSWVQILTNQKLKFIKFGCFSIAAVIVINWL